MKVKFLGINNAESKSTRLVSLLIDRTIAIDASSLVSRLTFEEQSRIQTILLSHGHYDHIKDVPIFAFNNTSNLTKIFATQPTLDILSSHLVDGLIYPKFTDGDSYIGRKTLELCPLSQFHTVDIDGYSILPLPVAHTIPAVGFEITSSNRRKLFYTGDTGPVLTTLWQYVNPHLIIIDASFPNDLEDAALKSGHMCPSFIKEELVQFYRIKKYFPKVFTVHMSPNYQSQIETELLNIGKELGCQLRSAVMDEEIEV